MTVTAPASIGQIFRDGSAAMFGGNNVIDFMGIKAQAVFQLAILAAMGSPFFDLSAKTFGDVGHDPSLPKF
jgi:hypothetical protein